MLPGAGLAQRRHAFGTQLFVGAAILREPIRHLARRAVRQYVLRLPVGMRRPRLAVPLRGLACGSFPITRNVRDRVLPGYPSNNEKGVGFALRGMFRAC